MIRFASLCLGLVVGACAAPEAGPQPATVAAATPDTATTVVDAMATRRPLADTLVEPAWLGRDSATRVTVLTGRFDPARDTNFVVLDAVYTDGDGEYLLRREAAAALERLVDAAGADGVELKVKSATRNFERQAQIWEAKWRGERLLEGGLNLAKSGLPDTAKARKILLYSSMPGTSRHHWGTDVDLNAFTNEYFDEGRGAEEYAWLRRNAADYGFYQPYTSKEGGRTGYEEERWHWSYAPLSIPLLRAYNEQVDYSMIEGFDGAEVAAEVQAIDDYVLGVNEELL